MTLSQIRTHRALDRPLCGEPVSVTPGAAEVALVATAEMAADERGLVHGGFVFGLADHAAMLAVNEPNVVLVRAEVRFVAPVAVGDRMTARARVETSGAGGARPVVEAEVMVEERAVFEGTLHCAVPSRHVLALDRGDGEEGA
jgi:acyl-coenzyme A thioesterase PaaI-like protein